MTESYKIEVRVYNKLNADKPVHQQIFEREVDFLEYAHAFFGNLSSVEQAEGKEDFDLMTDMLSDFTKWEESAKEFGNNNIPFGFESINYYFNADLVISVEGDAREYSQN